MLNETTDKVDINISASQWNQHFLAFEVDCTAQHSGQTSRPGPLNQHLATLHQQEHSINNRLILHRYNLIDQTLNNRERQGTRTLNCNTIGDSGNIRQRLQCTGFQRCTTTISPGSLYTNNGDIWLERTGCNGNA